MVALQSLHTNSSTDLIIETATSDKDIIFKVNDVNSSTEVARFDGDVSSFKMAQVKDYVGCYWRNNLRWRHRYNFEGGSNGDINIPANIGLTFGDDGE